MSAPNPAKRRRLDQTGLSKPFKSPLKTNRTAANARLPSSTSAVSRTITEKGVPRSAPSQTLSYTLPRPRLSPHKPTSTRLSPSLQSRIATLRSEIDTLTQARSLLQSPSAPSVSHNANLTSDADLQRLTSQWTGIAQAAAEAVFSTTRERVQRMGGVAAWREREARKTERMRQWAEDDIKMREEEEAKRRGEVEDEDEDEDDEDEEKEQGSDDVGASKDADLKLQLSLLSPTERAEVKACRREARRQARVTGQEYALAPEPEGARLEVVESERVGDEDEEREKKRRAVMMPQVKMGGTKDDEPFTMGMMLAVLGIDEVTMGWDGEAGRWAA